MYVGPDQIAEGLEDLAAQRVATEFLLTEDGLTVNVDLEDATAARNKPEIRDDVLIVAQDVTCSAHGATRIVSTETIGDAYGMAHGRKTKGRNL